MHFHVLVMQSFRNLQVVKRQQVEEFARRLTLSAISSNINYFKCHKTHLQSIADRTDRPLQWMMNIKIHGWLLRV